ncbi:hypothetical protein [Allochromatium warmingii]|uniref:hypothetical protein n=1 Tax=Allochromatium warmingii TaxID=61595 RepID=UPI0015A50DF8|nr:hypothetical protein [Allochromatium warmingii]
MADVSPAKRLGESLVEEVDEVEEALLEFVSGGKASALEQSAGAIKRVQLNGSGSV